MGCGFFIQCRVQLRLDVVIDLDASGIRFVTGQPQHQIVLSRRERECHWRLPRLFCSVNKYVGSRRLAADEDALGERFEFDLLILDVAPLH